MESRHLGPIDLDGGPGGGAMDASVPFANGALAVRLEIDFPGRLNGSVINDVDVVIDQLEPLQKVGLETISAGIHRRGSAPAKMFETWEKKEAGGDGNTEDFLEGLRPKHVTILPDGGQYSAERVVIRYAMDDGSVSGEIKVRFLERTGPELAPAPPGGFS